MNSKSGQYYSRLFFFNYNNLCNLSFALGDVFVFLNKEHFQLFRKQDGRLFGFPEPPIQVMTAYSVA
jgi:hypothetical protein